MQDQPGLLLKTKQQLVEKGKPAAEIEEEEPTTPTGEEFRIRTPLTCPPAPRKPKSPPVMSCVVDNVSRPKYCVIPYSELQAFFASTSC